MYAQLNLLSVYYMVNMVQSSSICDGRCLPLFVHPRLRHITHEVYECESHYAGRRFAFSLRLRYSHLFEDHVLYYYGLAIHHIL